MIKHNNWTVQDEIFPLLKLILPMFESIFGKDVMAKEHCEVSIDMNCSTAPRIEFKPTRIILKAEHGHFCQVIFQLAHELSHYAVRQNTDYQYINCAIAAFEEPSAEAMSMYILKLCAESCSNSELYKDYPDYAKNFKKYHDSIYNEVSGRNPSDYSEWTIICEGFSGDLTSDLQRPNVSAMRNTLYDAFAKFPAEIGLFIKYPLYIRSIPFEKLIDETAWKTAEPSKALFINSICSIQPMCI